MFESLRLVFIALSEWLSKWRWHVLDNEVCTREKLCFHLENPLGKFLRHLQIKRLTYKGKSSENVFQTEEQKVMKAMYRKVQWPEDLNDDFESHSRGIQPHGKIIGPLFA